MAGFTFHLHRGIASWHDSRETYLYQRGGPGAQLCQTMTRATVEAGLVITSRPADPFRGVPWVTPLIGSGCLEIGAIDQVTPAAFGESVRDALSLLNVADAWPEVDQLGSAQVFAEQLALDRMSSEGHSSPGGAPAAAAVAPVIEGRNARVVLIASLLSRIFYLAKARSASPLKRWNAENARIASDGLRRGEREEMEATVAACVMHLDSAAREFDVSRAGSLDNNVCAAVGRLLGTIQSDLDRRIGGEIGTGNLRMVTEAAWFLMASSVALYPGWTDLLFKLMLGDHNLAQGTARPYITDQSDVGRRVEQLFYEPSETSWRSWNSRQSETRREEFYLACAEVLWAETGAREAAPIEAAGGNRLPVPCAFVVSFDLETEMALWNSAPREHEYFVLIPIHVQPAVNSTRAKMCWIRGRIDKDKEVGPDDFDQFRTPSSWEVVSGDMTMPDAPHVVHLSGCPLLTLPDRNDAPGLYSALAAALSDSAVAYSEHSLHLSHAVTIDEYLALQQTESELLHAVMSSRDSTDTSLALPTELVSSTTDNEVRSSNPRYWMALGVPVAEPAIRSRVVTQLTVKNVLAKAGQGGSKRLEGSDDFHALVDPDANSARVELEPSEFDAMFGAAEPSVHEDPSADAPVTDTGRLAGLVVNRRISRDDGGILYWLGLEVVSDRAESFIGDLYHYSAHLAPKYRDHRILLSGTCPIEVKS